MDEYTARNLIIAILKQNVNILTLSIDEEENKTCTVKFNVPKNIIIPEYNSSHSLTTTY